jgi:hypothetical protein
VLLHAFRHENYTAAAWYGITMGCMLVFGQTAIGVMQRTLFDQLWRSGR